MTREFNPEVGYVHHQYYPDDYEIVGLDGQCYQENPEVGCLFHQYYPDDPVEEPTECLDCLWYIAHTNESQCLICWATGRTLEGGPE